MHNFSHSQKIRNSSPHVHTVIATATPGQGCVGQEKLGQSYGSGHPCGCGRARHVSGHPHPDLWRVSRSASDARSSVLGCSTCTLRSHDLSDSGFESWKRSLGIRQVRTFTDATKIEQNRKYCPELSSSLFSQTSANDCA